jgi:hypothetical protein
VDAKLIDTIGIEGRQLHVVRQQFAVTLTDSPDPQHQHSGWQMHPDQARSLAHALLAAVDADT